MEFRSGGIKSLHFLAMNESNNFSRFLQVEPERPCPIRYSLPPRLEDWPVVTLVASLLPPTSACLSVPILSPPPPS